MSPLLLSYWCLTLAMPATAPEPEPVFTREVESSLGTYRFHIRLERSAMPLNQPFRMWVRVELVSGAAWSDNHVLRVDARMPHHRHGMNREPLIQARGQGTFLVEGMLFHMPGYWEIYLDATHKGQTERGQFHVDLE